MPTKADFEVTDPKQIFAVDLDTANNSLQENFADEVIQIDESYKTGLYDSYTVGYLLVKPFKYIVYPIFLQVVVTLQLISLFPIEFYIYIARKVFRRNFSQNFRKSYLSYLRGKGVSFLKIDLDYKRIVKKSYNQRMKKLDKYMEYYEWETFEK